MKKISACAALILLCLLGLSRTSPCAMDDAIWVDADVNTRLVQLGEHFRLILTAGARHGIVYLPGKNVLLPGCQVLNYAEEEVSKKHEGYLARQAVYDLAAFDIPDVIIPRLTTRFRFSEGRTQDLGSLPIKISIRSMNPEEGLSLIDPRPPHKPSRTWLLIFAGVLAVALFTFVLVTRRRSGLKKRKILFAPAHLTAYKSLAILEKQPPTDSKQYFIELSRIVRQYLANRYRFPAMEQSRVLIIRTLENLGIEAKRREMIDQLLTEADLVKFALETASVIQKQEALIRTRAMIELTRERLEVPKKGSPA
jgi:hypothetical protein